MASLADASRSSGFKPLSPDVFERMLAVASLLLLIAMLTALFRGQDEWYRLSPFLWGHLATIATALALTPVMLLRRRGDRLHRRLGYVWIAAMFGTAFVSLFIRDINRGGFSFIHILSVWTLIQVPLIYWTARTHQIAKHRSAVRGMVFGALLIAGFFTFPFDRLMGHWLFGTTWPAARIIP
jgi:uncharacterized membrane protein